MLAAAAASKCFRAPHSFKRPITFLCSFHSHIYHNHNHNYNYNLGQRRRLLGWSSSGSGIYGNIPLLTNNTYTNTNTNSSWDLSKERRSAAHLNAFLSDSAPSTPPFREPVIISIFHFVFFCFIMPNPIQSNPI